MPACEIVDRMRAFFLHVPHLTGAVAVVCVFGIGRETASMIARRSSRSDLFNSTVCSADDDSSGFRLRCGCCISPQPCERPGTRAGRHFRQGITSCDPQ